MMSTILIEIRNKLVNPFFPLYLLQFTTSVGERCFLFFDIIVISFWFQLRDNADCQLIDKWSFYTEIVFFAIAAYKLFIELPIQYKTNEQWKNQLFDIADYLELFLSIVILIGLTYAYLQNEECYHLRKFVLGYLFITYLILMIWLISFIFIHCSREEFNRNS
ncbi:unnamed protein product [Paramecium sonneborni]|uniref:Uncharacterized protein n=1 Tax=Paramecium sonneborni TaxID=65129 RepID=A0A8S1P9L6_9CILI|nr:unnamed protein product [Paramecium sonneborni]